MNYNMHQGEWHRLPRESFWLGAIFLSEAFYRLKCGICGSNPVPDRRFIDGCCWIEPGYCLDAPELLPAGGMGSFSLQDDSDSIPEQLTWERP